jgi:hypothetical protein
MIANMSQSQRRVADELNSTNFDNRMHVDDEDEDMFARPPPKRRAPPTVGRADSTTVVSPGGAERRDPAPLLLLARDSQRAELRRNGVQSTDERSRMQCLMSADKLKGVWRSARHVRACAQLCRAQSMRCRVLATIYTSSQPPMA